MSHLHAPIHSLATSSAISHAVNPSQMAIDLVMVYALIVIEEIIKLRVDLSITIIILEELEKE